MASCEKSEFDKDVALKDNTDVKDNTHDIEDWNRISKRKESYTKRDDKTEGNWRSESGGNQRRYGNWRTTSSENRRSDIDGNWRTKRVDHPKRDIQENWRYARDHRATSENFKMEEGYSESEVHGCWRINSNKLKESEDVWNAVEELHKELPRLFSVPPRRSSISRGHTMEFIMSFISPSCDKAQIKEAADAIRKKVYFLFIMLYFEAPFELKKIQKYQHTPENEFYELGKNSWKIVLKEDADTVVNERDVSLSQDSREEGAKSDMPGSMLINNSFTSVSLSNQVLLPSQVMDNEYLYFPPTEEAIGKMKRSIGGKWIVNGRFSMAKQDNTWSNLLPLCKEGILIGMKASTAMITDDQQYMGGETILCYTVDANDVNDVKKAGDAIRSVTESKYIMYYKTNVSSEKGRYAKEGCNFVTSYLHTVKGTFYARDHYKRWMLMKL